MADATDRKFLATAEELAKIWSKDPSSRVAAVAVGSTRNKVAFGYNGFPPGIQDTVERLHDRSTKYALTLHAEVNALSNATFDVKTLYVTHHPCAQCALRILGQRTVKRVVYRHNPEFESRWFESIDFAREILTEAGVELEGVDL